MNLMGQLPEQKRHAIKQCLSDDESEPELVESEEEVNDTQLSVKERTKLKNQKDLVMYQLS